MKWLKTLRWLAAVTKKIRFTAHVKDRATAREIDQDDVRKILEKPEGIIEDKHEAPITAMAGP